jgi:UDP-glucuronate 4-epimerase
LKILLTGAAGFIGYHVGEALLGRGDEVLGVDNLNAYYDPQLKRDRLVRLERHERFRFWQSDVSDREAVMAFVADHPDIELIVHLAAQAGVRYSMENPYDYISTNVMGQVVMLEAARTLPRLRHMVYASSSSVYGGNEQLPFSEQDRVDQPLSTYAATKRAGELLGHVYGHLYGVPLTGLRFFTVYGPWGRPDMAYYGFAQSIIERRPLPLYQAGVLRRDFTYIDDVVAAILACAAQPPTAPNPTRVLNVGNNRSESVLHLVSLLEKSLGRRAIVENVTKPAADVSETSANIDAIAALTGFSAATCLDVGIPKFADWFCEYHGFTRGLQVV